MNIFVDYIGHETLYYSLHLLLEKRLKHNLYSPLMDKKWKEFGLHLPVPLAGQKGIKQEKDFSFFTSIFGNSIKIVTFEQFKKMDFDIFMFTRHDHENPFCNLGEKYKKPVIRHIANILEKPKRCKNVLLSTLEPMPVGTDWITYHPEHNPSFKFVKPKNYKSIKSFFANHKVYQVRLDQWNRFKGKLNDFDFAMHGAFGEDREVPVLKMPNKIQESSFVWHLKTGCCGYIARQALSCGKPCIINSYEGSDIFHTLSRNYFKDGFNCIDINPAVRSFEESIELIRKWSEPEVYNKKTLEIVKYFGKTINFRRESKMISIWLDKIVSKKV
jgi:hypothetical protein